MTARAPLGPALSRQMALTGNVRAVREGVGAAQGRCWLVTVNVRRGELVCVERVGVDWTDGTPREARRWEK